MIFFQYICKLKGESENPIKRVANCLIKKFFNKMKKTLLTLGVLGLMTLGFASCGSTDCDCTVTLDDETVALYDDDNPTISDYDGDCEDVSASELPSDWQNIQSLGGTFTCEED